MHVNVQLDHRLTRNKLIIHSSLAKLFPRIMYRIRRMIFKFEYIGELEFMFENILELESVEQEGACDIKNQRSTISCKCTFKGTLA